MSAISGKANQLVNFYRSSALPCPYIPGQLERKLFTRLSTDDPDRINGMLTVGGFRRSHEFVYRPICDHCSACVPVRIDASRFAHSRNSRRVMRRNRSLVATSLPPLPTAEQYRLFLRYQTSRHADGDMASMGADDYAAMIREGSAHSQVIEWRDQADGSLQAAVLVDEVRDGLSAVYSFFNPDQPERSLGRFIVLSLVERARASGLTHIYLGYWIRNSRKMSYKAQFHALEALEQGDWRPMTMPPVVAEATAQDRPGATAQDRPGATAQDRPGAAAQDRPAVAGSDAPKTTAAPTARVHPQAADAPAHGPMAADAPAHGPMAAAGPDVAAPRPRRLSRGKVG